jgi:hypothetical protein
MAYPLLQDASLKFTDAIYYGQVPGSFVPLTRNINTTAPLTGGGNLSTDLTLALTTNPASQTPVGVSRLINTAAPLTGGGNLSADLSLAVSTFGTGNSGVVPASGGGTTNFLRADGTWQAVAGGTGVPATRNINTASPLAGGGNLSADLNLSVGTFSAGAPGVVPLSGGGTTNFLRADGTWASPTTGGGFVLLQTSGIFQQIGMSYVQYSEAGNFVNFIPASLGGTITPIDAIHLQTTANGLTLDGVASNSAIPAGVIQFRAARGTYASRTSVQNGDMLGAVFPRATTDSGETSYQAWTLLADGTPTGGQFQYASRFSGSLITAANTVSQWTTGNGMFVGWNAASRPSITSLLDINGPIATATNTQTGNYVFTATDSAVYFDCTANNFTATIPDPTTCAGRWLYVKRIDQIGTHILTITATPKSIDGTLNIALWGGLDAVCLQSDGSQWRVMAWYRSPLVYSLIASQTPISNTSAKTILYTPPVNQLPDSNHYNYANGIRISWRCGGVFGTTGSPTLRLQMADSGIGSTIYYDSGVFTAPTTATAVQWEMEGAGLLSTAGANYRFAGGKLGIQAASGNVMTVYAGRPAVSISWTPGIAPWVTWGTPNASNTITLDYFDIEYWSPAAYA